MSQFLTNLGKALRDERWEDYEETWLDAIESESASFNDFIRATSEAVSAGQGTRAGNALALLIPQVQAMPAQRQMDYYQALVHCQPRNTDFREALITIYRREFGQLEGFDNYIRTADLRNSPNPSQAIQSFLNLVQYVPGTFVYHRSGWGIGVIRELTSIEEASVAVIDFVEKNAHKVRVDAIPAICELLAADHFRVLLWKDPERLKMLAQGEPLELFFKVLQTSKRPMPLARVREHLIPKVIEASDWTRWWSRLRANIKNDPRIAMTGGKSPEYFVSDKPQGLNATLDRRLSGRDLKTQLQLLREAAAEIKPEQRDTLLPYCTRLKRDLRHATGAPELLLEVMLFLRHQGVDLEGLPTVHELLARAEHPGDVLNLLPRQEDQREVVQLIREQDRDGWEELHTDLLLRADDALREHLIELMIADGRGDEVDSYAKEVHRLPKKAPLMFMWLLRKVARGDFTHIESLRGTSGVDMYTKAISMLTDYYVILQDKPTKQVDLIVKRFRSHLGNPALVTKVVQAAPLAAARDVYKEIENSPGLSDTIRQGLLATVLRLQPTLLAQEARTAAFVDDSVIYSTDAGIAKKQGELEEIKNVKLPAVYKLIGEAREFGDLSENAEYTSAIEERENLNRRALEIQNELAKARRLDPTQSSADRASLGSRVKLLNLESGEILEYLLLGPWDGAAGDNVLSYLSPMGRSLLDKRQGEEFTVQLPAGSSRYRVMAIARYTPK
ncbi:MAG: GreA/GreB family elongation factor [Planctomycetota bacterium]